MTNNRSGKYSRALLVVGLSVLGLSASLHADDTEIYQTTYDASLSGRPKVLIAIDDSGSMDTVVPNSKPAYDPAATYTGTAVSTRIYWSTTGSPPAANTSQYFDVAKNRCASSYDSLTNQGFFQTRARRWADQVTTTNCVNVRVCRNPTYPYLRSSNNRCYKVPGFTGTWVSATTEQSCTDTVTPGSWVALNSGAQSPRHVECQVDVTNSNPANGSGQANGYPKTNVVDNLAFSAATPAASNVNWGSESYTFYSAHYLNYLSDPDTRDQTRMEIAQDVITSLIAANIGIDFGLLEFNSNWSAVPTANGGRIVHRIIENMTAAQRSNVVDMVNTMTAAGSTPLCESTYEAYNYLAGKPVVYGNKGYYLANGSLGIGDILPRDLLAEVSPLIYRSPATDCAYTYVVIMTDGAPQNDTNANAAIETLTGRTCASYATDGQGNTKNCMVEMARYMANTDLDNDTTNGNQFGITYTIGFATNQQLLQDAATAGKGEYYTAGNATELTAAFQGAILSILETDTTFTSPAVAVDTFSRTQSRDEVFYAMFKPADRIDWRGNIKKLKLGVIDGVPALVDKNGAAAIESDGFIKDSATTFWSTAADGAAVEQGGVGGLLALRDPATRSIKTNTGTAGALQDFNSTNLDYSAFGFSDAAQLFSYFGVPNQAALDTLVAWARGTDVYDEDSDGNITENRPWILGDILHSQPLVVNYGALGSFTKTNPDLRLVVGTNAGFVHMFGNDNGQEDWAFFPKELAPVLRQRAINPLSSEHVYGVDNTAVVYTKDVGRDGTISASDGDKAYVYLTLGRGGRAIYALDISNPDSPTFLWMIDNTSTGFGELGQTWSRPAVTTIPGYKDNAGKFKPVLVFAAGYDTNKDASGVGTADSMGRGLFVVDAVTGALVWSVTPAADSATNMQEAGLLHSVPSPVTVLDSNGDAITDRVYFGDTGGNLWRVDMPGPTLPDSSQDGFHIVQMADLNGGTDLTDRRFFNAPDVVRTSYRGNAFDAIAIGSGDRNNPNATDNQDQFYMLRDERVSPYATEFDRSADCDSDPDTIDDLRCNLPLTVDDLYDVTPNTIQDGVDAAERSAAVSALVAARGWRMDLGTGEKSLAKSLTINGKLYFTTFSPEVDNTNVCVPTPGTGLLYIVRLTDATSVEVVTIGELIPEITPPVFPPPPPPDIECPDCGKIILLLPLGKTLPTGVQLPVPYGSYWYREEY